MFGRALLVAVAVLLGMWLQRQYQLADRLLESAPQEAVSDEAMDHGTASHEAMGHVAASHEAMGHDTASHEAMGHDAGHAAPTGAGTAVTERKILYWWDPMMPEYKSDKPGKSPMGMDMVPVYDDEAPAGEPGVVSIAPEVVNKLGVRTARAEEGPLEHRIDSGGFVGYDESRMTRVAAPAAGRVGRFVVTSAGQRVKSGDLLLEIESADGQLVPVTAPVDGIVAEIGDVYRGMAIGPGTEIMTLVDASTVWIKGEVFESDSGWLYVGQPVEARFPERPGEAWKGVVEVILPKVEYANRTVRYRMRFDNPDGFLVPNMFAEVTFYGKTGKNVVHIPRQALIREGDAERVIVALGNGRFSPRTVTAGAEFGERIAIESGLQAGEEIVTSAQFLIDSEASLQASMSRLDGAAPSTHHHH
jgi:Cu(I)/Ag(I) efflux system membrane fusion protein